MKKKLIVISFCALLLGITFSILLDLHKTKAASQNLNEFSNQFLNENKPFTALVNKFDYDINNKLMVVNGEVTDVFTRLQSDQQYGFLAFFAKSLRYYLRNEMDNPSLQTMDINIICETKDKTYMLTNVVPDKKVKVKSDSSLYIDNEHILSSKEYKTKIEHFLYNNPDFKFVNQDIEIIRYAMQVFNKITVGGNYYNHEKDSKAILDLVTNKFGITEEEYTQIYKKYFFLLE